MTAGDAPRRRESALALGRRLASGVVGLARLELQRGRQEVGERIGQTTRGAILFGIAAAFALLSLISLVVLIIALVALLLPLWASALVVLGTCLILAVLFAFLGSRLIRSPVPQETIDAVKEDIEWARRLLRRE